MVDFQYLYKGLCGLARAHEAKAMAGHLGAAVVAGYFYGEEHHDLDRQVYRAIERDLDRIMRGEETVWYDASKAGITIPELFEPLPDEGPQRDQISQIAQALSANIGKTRESGHNVIFSSIAIRALHDHPQYATPTLIQGVCKLIQSFNDANPGQGYYGEERGWITGDQVTLPPADPSFPPYESEQDMANVVVGDLIRWGSVRRRGFGGLFHLINHATALTELTRFGYEDLARQGWAAHHHHVRLWRSLPDVAGELGALERADQDPRTPEYWSRTSSSQWSGWLTHRVKTLYGFFSLIRFVDEPAQRKKAEENFLYLMA